MRSIKLMADYFCFPLWEVSSTEIGNIDPQDLPISQALREDITRWSDAFDAILNVDDPANSGFKSKEAEASFICEGRRLGEQLKRELGPEYAVFVQDLGSSVANPIET